MELAFEDAVPLYTAGEWIAAQQQNYSSDRIWTPLSTVINPSPYPTELTELSPTKNC